MAGWTNSRGQPGGEAPAVTFIVKDRVLGHNPAAALYTAKPMKGKTESDF